MKILITENKRKDLAYKLLDDIFNGLTREDIELIPKKGYIINASKGSAVSNQRVMFKDSDGESILKWSGHNTGLYVYEDFWLPLRVFSFGEIELERFIFRWFKDRVKIEPEEVYLEGFSEDYRY